MDFYSFTNLIVKHQKIGIIPEDFRFPEEISLSASVWDFIVKLYDFTKPYDYEHAISLFSIDGDVISTPITKGSHENVITRYGLKVTYTRKTENLYEKQVFVNGKLLFKFSKKKSEVPENPKINPLFLIHSHPKSVSNNVNQYSFFSNTDIKSLLGSSYICQGLVTDEFFLMCKHKNSPKVVDADTVEVIKKINQIYFQERSIDQNTLRKLGMIVYRGDLRKNLIRL